MKMLILAGLAFGPLFSSAFEIEKTENRVIQLGAGVIFPGGYVVNKCVQGVTKKSAVSPRVIYKLVKVPRAYGDEPDLNQLELRIQMDVITFEAELVSVAPQMDFETLGLDSSRFDRICGHHYISHVNYGGSVSLIMLGTKKSLERVSEITVVESETGGSMVEEFLKMAEKEARKGNYVGHGFKTVGGILSFTNEDSIAMFNKFRSYYLSHEFAEAAGTGSGPAIISATTQEYPTAVKLGLISIK